MPNKIIIVDIDGTLANIDHRKHIVDKPFNEITQSDWNNFFAIIGNDSLNQWCAEIIRRFKPDHQIALLTGRPDRTRYRTEKWLKDSGVPFDWLMMRDDGDDSDQIIVKKGMLDQLKGEGEILFAIDDLADVAKLWRDNGIVCLHCSDSLT